MGYIKRWNFADITQQIHAAARECSDSHNDGFTTWPIKQDLYQLKWTLDEALKRCPAFAPEKEWLVEQEKKKLIQILKK